jgi:sterol 14-demethylase
MKLKVIKENKMKNTPPELPGPPLVGHTLEFRRDRQGLFKRGYDSLGPIFTIRVLNKPAVVLLDPDYHTTFFAETDKKLSSDKAYGFLRAMFGEAALTAPPVQYYEQRPILYAPFKGEKMAGYIKVMQIEVQQWLDSLPEQGELELVATLTKLIQNVAAHALMGKAFRDQLGDEFWSQYTILSKALDPLLPPNLPLPRFYRRDKAKKRLYEMIQAMIDERRLNPEKYDDFLQEFINAKYKDGRPAGDDLIIRLVMGLMFAGHETTVGQTSWTIVQLLQNPAYRELVQQELQEKLPMGTQLDNQVLNQLEHVEWAVLETSRMHPSADLLMRIVNDEIEFGDYRVPPGWLIFTAAGTAHRSPELFADPDVYDPLRFAPGREEDRQHRFAMIGFGGGMHKCAGINFANNEMAVITALLFQQFQLELVGKHPETFYGLGAARPDQAQVRFVRKTN